MSGIYVDSVELAKIETRLTRAIMESIEGDNCHPKTFDCPVCDHTTLSETRNERVDSKLLSRRYCFGCGNTFNKEVIYKKVKV